MARALSARWVAVPGLVLGVAALAALVTLTAYALDPLVLLGVVVGLGAVSLALLEPTFALYLGVLLVPLDLLALELGPAGISPAEAMFAAAGLGWAARRLAQGRLPVVPSPLTGPLALLLFAIVAGFFVAEDPGAVAKTLVMWTSFFLVFQMVADDGRPATVRRLLLVLATSGAVVGASAMVEAAQVGQQATPFAQEVTGRSRGAFGSPNILATFELLALPGALAMGLRGPVALRPFAGAAFVVLFVGLSFSLSRGGLLGALAALLAMLAWRPFRVAVLVLVPILAISALGSGNLLGDVQQVDRVAQRIHSVSYAASGETDPRFEIWRVAPSIFTDHPLVGVGENNFSVVSPRYGLLLPPRGQAYDHAHNIVFTIAIELGLVGLGGLVWLIVAAARLLWRTCRGNRVTAPLAFAIAGALVGLAVQGLVDYTLRSNIIAAIAFAFLGCAVVLGARSDVAGEAPAGQGPAAPAA